MQKTILKILCVVFIPLLFLAWGIDHEKKMGAHFTAQNVDPDYAYLLNSLNIVNGYVPGHTDHPGTPVQLWGAIILRATHAWACKIDCESLETSVLKNPELYVRGINWSLQGLIFLGFCIFSATVLSISQSIPITVLSQLSLFSSSLPAMFSRPVSAEPLMCAILLLYVSVFIWEISSKEKKYRLLSASFFGVIAGIAFATKINFLPLCALILAWMSLPAIFLFSTCAIISFALSTIPIWERFALLKSWIIALLEHNGRHGQGSTGLPSWTQVSSVLEDAWYVSPILSILFFFLAAKVFLAFKKKVFSQSHWAMASILLAIIGNMLIVMKHPGYWYLFPAVFLILPLPYILSTQISLRYFYPVATLALSAAAILTFSRMKNFQSAQERYAKDETEIQHIISKNPSCKVIEYFRSSSKQFALLFGNTFASFKYANQLSELYPTTVTYNLGRRAFADWKGDVDENTNNILFNLCVLFTGTLQSTPGYKINLTDWELKPLFEGSELGVYKAVKRSSP